MNANFLLFVLLTYSMCYGMIVASENPEVEVPTFDMPTFEFEELGGCAGFTDCLEYIGKVIYNLGLGFIAIIVLIFLLGTYLVSLIAILIAFQFVGLEGSAPWVQTLAIVPFAFAIALLAYKLLRKGDADTNT